MLAVGPLTPSEQSLYYRPSGTLGQLQLFTTLVGKLINPGICEASIADCGRKDCGMTHFHDKDVKQALIEIAPDERETINASQYGEIKGS